MSGCRVGGWKQGGFLAVRTGLARTRRREYKRGARSPREIVAMKQGGEQELILLHLLISNIFTVHIPSITSIPSLLLHPFLISPSTSNA